MSVLKENFQTELAIKKLNELNFDYNKYWNLNVIKVLSDLEKYQLNIKKHIKNNNLDIIKLLYYNNIEFNKKYTLICAIKYNKLDIINFVHLSCNKFCKNIDIHTQKCSYPVSIWLTKNCSNYTKTKINF